MSPNPERRICHSSILAQCHKQVSLGRWEGLQDLGWCLHTQSAISVPGSAGRPGKCELAGRWRRQWQPELSGGKSIKDKVRSQVRLWCQTTGTEASSSTHWHPWHMALGCWHKHVPTPCSLIGEPAWSVWANLILPDPGHSAGAYTSSMLWLFSMEINSGTHVHGGRRQSHCMVSSDWGSSQNWVGWGHIEAS